MNRNLKASISYFRLARFENNFISLDDPYYLPRIFEQFATFVNCKQIKPNYLVNSS